MGRFRERRRRGVEGDVDSYEDLTADRVLQVGHLWMRFRATGIDGEVPIAQVLTFEDRKLKRLDSYYTREQALESLGILDRPG